jgi:hypothetical protein
MSVPLRARSFDISYFTRTMEKEAVEIYSGGLR